MSFSFTDSDFKQQRLKAWQPILTASSVLPVFLVIGLVFLPLGIALLVASDEVGELASCNGLFFSDHLRFFT